MGESHSEAAARAGGAPAERGGPVRIGEVEPVRGLARALPLLTSSAVKCYRACPRLYKLSQEDLWRVVRNADALRFGTLFHAGLEAWFGMAGLTRDSAKWLEVALLAIAEHEADPFDHVRAEALMIGYHYRWADEPLEVVAVEQQFRAPHINPDTNAASRTWDEGGKMDVVVRTPDSRTWVVEHKTSSEDITPGSTYWRRLRLDAQISTYIRGASTLGYGDIAGCIYDVIGKPTIRPYKATPLEAREYTKPRDKACPECKRKASAPGPHTIDGLTCADGRVVTDPGGKLYANMRERDETVEEYRARLLEDIGANPGRYYQRGEIVRLEEDRRGAALDMWQTGRAIADSRRLKHWPRNPSACVSFGRTCDFFDVCTNAASLDDTTRFRRATTQHEELAPE